MPIHQYRSGNRREDGWALLFNNNCTKHENKMFPSQEFTFTQCISEQPYDHRPTEDECSKIIFRPREVTINGLLEFACHGGVFSPTCRSTNTDGSFHIKAKTDNNFVSSSTVFFDFDNMSTPMQEFIDGLNFKPSFGYTSYRNGMEGLGFRFRLGYVFHKPIVGNQNYRELYVAVCTANDFPIETKATGGLDRRTEAQCYFGTRTDAETYYGGYKYAQQDFNEYRSTEKTQAFFESSKTSTLSTTVATNVSTDINPEFLTDFNNLNTQDFLNKYYPQYGQNYYHSLSTSLILDSTKWFFRYPDFYVEVRHKRQGKYTLKWQIGDDRKRKLFFTAQIMLHNMPTLTMENLLFNLRMERDWYYINTDGKVSNRYLIDVAKNTMVKRYTLNPTIHGTFKVNKKYWEEQGISTKAASNHIRRYLKVQTIRPLINAYASVSDNVKMLKEHGIKITERTLRRMVTEGDIQINNTGASYPYLSDCLKNVTIQGKPIETGILQLIRTDGTITQQAMADALMVDIRTIKRYIDDMKGKVIRREGNNRSGRWIVL